MKFNLNLPAECLSKNFHEMSAENLNTALKNFVFESRKHNGDVYPSETVYSLYATLQSYLKAENVRMDLFGGEEFTQSKAALDAVMKERSAIGLGIASRKPTEEITDEEENVLWEKRVLGEETPQQLLDTILYLTGLNFSLRGGNEHRNLRLLTNPQITGPFIDGNGRSYLLYKEDISKNNAGGLKERKTKAKEVRAYHNPTDPSRCYVRLFQKYTNLAKSAGKSEAFYYQPLKKVKNGQWFSSCPVSHNTLQGTVKRMCQIAGIESRKTNHSLRATSATRLYQKNVDEQLISEQTSRDGPWIGVKKLTDGKMHFQSNNAVLPYKSLAPLQRPFSGEACISIGCFGLMRYKCTDRRVFLCQIEDAVHSPSASFSTASTTVTTMKTTTAMTTKLAAITTASTVTTGTHGTDITTSMSHKTMNAFLEHISSTAMYVETEIIPTKVVSVHHMEDTKSEAQRPLLSASSVVLLQVVSGLCLKLVF